MAVQAAAPPEPLSHSRVNIRASPAPRPQARAMAIFFAREVVSVFFIRSLLCVPALYVS